MVKITSPHKVHFEGKAERVTAVNEVGEFDVLPGHHSFITLLSPCTVVVETEKKSVLENEVNNGLMHVKNNVVHVFLLE